VIFIHEDEAFPDLLQIVAQDRGIDRALVEKDYWVVHVLWALHGGRFEVWFKGGTSLSKGFGLIERFSEDLDLKLMPRDQSGAPEVNWKGDKAKHVEKRKAWYRWLAEQVHVPETTVTLDEEHWQVDRKAHGAAIQVIYPGKYLKGLGSHNLRYVKLEVGDARVTPFVLKPVSSFVHDHLDRIGQLEHFADNRPSAVRVVHPWVTLLEKLSLICTKYAQVGAGAARFVRHYEDAARIAAATIDPPSGYTLASLTQEMTAGGTLAMLATANDPALALHDLDRRRELEAAYAALADMYWGPRQSLADACAVLRGWLSEARLG
jgi:hypothetical protein